MGMLGATTYCARFWSADIYEVVYEKEKFKPHFFDFVGYITLILGGGITGIILFLIAKTGINISVSSAKDIHLTKAASVLISYVGGLYHFKVQKQLGKVIEKVFQEQNKNKKR